MKKYLKSMNETEDKPSHNASVVVLSTGAQGTGTSVLLKMDKHSYIFNAPDGITRAMFAGFLGEIPAMENNSILRMRHAFSEKGKVKRNSIDIPEKHKDGDSKLERSKMKNSANVKKSSPQIDTEAILNLGMESVGSSIQGIPPVTGQNCDILIHEATMFDVQLQAAKNLCHSTVSQAIRTGKQMNAKFTLLTHFNKRMRHIPLFSDAFTEDVGYAFDFMQVKPNQLHLLYHMKPVFNALYGPSIASQELLMQKYASARNQTEMFSKGILEARETQDNLNYIEFLETCKMDRNHWKNGNLMEKLKIVEDNSDKDSG
ncbi:RNZ2-like protein [Mya arenaria]|uniref:ribonuclease Z n=1 Tax=Mya arenaria TaxID=6604 RepID=A0ABY7DBY5_MYAAR|nr:RNZ2-like protein [Mya arenaria]